MTWQRIFQLHCMDLMEVHGSNWHNNRKEGEGLMAVHWPNERQCHQNHAMWLKNKRSLKQNLLLFGANECRKGMSLLLTVSIQRVAITPVFISVSISFLFPFYFCLLSKPKLMILSQKLIDYFLYPCIGHLPGTGLSETWPDLFKFMNFACVRTFLQQIWEKGTEYQVEKLLLALSKKICYLTVYFEKQSRKESSSNVESSTTKSLVYPSWNQWFWLGK